MLKSVSDVVGKISDPKSRDSIASMVSPSTILNKSISSERSFAGTSISLSQAKAVAKQSGGKLNDVVLALSSGVVRRYLLEHGALPAKSMTAAVPISLREEGNTDANNQVFGMICSIATNIEDPKARLEAIIAQSTKSKEMSHPLRALMPQVSNVSMLGAPILVQILALLYSRSSLSDVLPPAANITVSNVPGPRQTLYAAGAELLHIFPVSISTHGLALNITVQSYRDQLDFGFIAGANIIPHVQVLCDMLPGEFAALEAAFAPPRQTLKARRVERDGSPHDRDAAAAVRPDQRHSHGLLRGRPEDRHAAGRALPRLAGDRVFLAPPDQGAERGRHPGDRAGPARLWRDRPARAGRGLRHRASDRRSRRPARSSQDRQGDLRRPRLGRLYRLADAAAAHRSRRRRGRRQHAAHARARRRIRSNCCASASATRCISCSSRIPAREPDKIFGSRVEQTFDAFMRKPVPRTDDAPAEPPVAGVGASPRLNLAFPQMIADYDAKHDPRTPILSPEEKKVFVDTFTKTGFTGGINWYRNMSRNWQRSAEIDHTVRVPSLMIMAENDRVLPPSAADGMEKIIPDLEKYLVRGSGHWTQQEKPEEVSAKLIEWRRKRFG